MLSKEQIIDLLNSINEELKSQDIRGEIFIVGGAAMCLAFDARKSTKDIDAVFAPTKNIRDIIKKIADQKGLSADWLNDSVKGFLSQNSESENLFNLSNLSVSAPTANYIFAMKAISARFDSSDIDDLIFLIQRMNLKTAEEALEIVLKYYPKNLIPQKTTYALEEIFEKLNLY